MSRIYDSPTGPLNRFVEDLRRERRDDSIPYIDPDAGGTRAQVLALFQDPGPKTKAEGGSGMLSWSNDDPSAECFCELLAETGIEWDMLVPWNAVRWYTGGKNPVQERAAGRLVLRRLLQLLPAARVVLTAGNTAKNQWITLTREHPPARQLRLFATLHPAGRGLTLGSRQPAHEGRSAIKAHLASLRDALGRLQ
jgi:hypothetical protein